MRTGGVAVKHTAACRNRIELAWGKTLEGRRKLQEAAARREAFAAPPAPAGGPVEDPDVVAPQADEEMEVQEPQALESGPQAAAAPDPRSHNLEDTDIESSNSDSGSDSGTMSADKED